MVAEGQGVSEVFEGQRVLAQPRLTGEGGDVAEGDHEMVVLELELARAHAGGEGDAATREVDLLDSAGIEVRTRAETADGSDGVENADAPRHHLGQHGLEGQVVVPAHQRDLHLATAELALQGLLEVQRRVHTAARGGDASAR